MNFRLLVFVDNKTKISTGISVKTPKFNSELELGNCVMKCYKTTATDFTD